MGLSPFGLTYSPNITLILLNKSAVIFGGNIAVTCYAPISYISAVVMLLMQGVSDGSQPLISLAYGEGKHDTTKAVRDLAYRFAFGVAAICSVILFLLRGSAAYLFGASEQVAVLVAQILPIFIIGFVFVSVSRVTTAYFYATGKKSLGLHFDLWGAADALRPAPDPPKCHGECEWNLGFCSLVPNHCHAAQFASNP